MDLHALAGVAPDFDGAARKGDAFFHVEQAHALPLYGAPANCGEIAAPAVVAHGEMQHAVLHRKFDPYVSR